jgi:hypothetical protein
MLKIKLLYVDSRKVFLLKSPDKSNALNWANSGLVGSEYSIYYCHLLIIEFSSAIVLFFLNL